MATRYACQPFITADDVLDASCGCDLDAVDDADLIELMIDQASDILSLVTGGVVSGICTVTVRPVNLCHDPYIDSMYPPRDWRRQFGGINTIPLRGPNTDIVEVVVDGVVLNPSEYGLLDNQYLYRKAGCWPQRNDLTSPATQTNTFEITYRFGREPDKLTRMACIELACELLKDVKGKASSLPRGVTSASIQGASISVRNRADALRSGDEQIPVVARFMSIYANDGVNMVAGVWAPELEQFWNLVEVEGPSGS